MNKIEKIRQYLKDNLEYFNVPSVGVGIVKDGEIVLCEGFGMADKENGLTSDADTIYQIGSCSKAFTSAAVAVLVDQGKIDWDTPVKQYMPWLRFKSEYTTEHVTVRDLLCHRTGLPRHDIGLVPLSYLTRRQAVENLAHDEPAWDFRSHWCYQNTCIIAAGMLVEEVSGKSWEQFVKEELLDKIGMTRTTFYVEAIENDPNHASPYEPSADGITKIPFYKFDPEDMSKGIGSAHTPAGGVASCASDMTKWIQFHLNNGSVNGQQIISEASMKEIHKPQMLMSPMLPMDIPEEDFHSYGLCWFIQSYRGHKMIEHGGNIDGFTANAAMVPDMNLGIVILSNMNSSVDPDAATRYIIDEYLGVEDANWAQRYKKMIDDMMAAGPGAFEALMATKIPDTTPSHPLEDYTGEFYNDAYRGIQFTIKDGKLHLDYGTISSDLDHFHYDTFITINGLVAGLKINFANDPNGKISTVSCDLIQTPPLGEVVFTRK